MDSNSRQIAILYEFIISNDFITYLELENQFLIKERTVRKDIKVINDHFKSLGIEILLKKSRGFYLKVKNEKTVIELKEQFQYRFIDSNDLRHNLISREDELMAHLFSPKKYIKLDDLAIQMNLNSRTISSLIKKVKIYFKDYGITLFARPHYGMKIFGRELDIRMCQVDVVCFYARYEDQINLFENSLCVFNLTEKEKEEITKICLRYVNTSKIEITQIEIRKLILLIMISHFREKNGNCIVFEKSEIDIVEIFSYDLKTESLIRELENYYKISYSYSEIILIKIFLIINLDYANDDFLKGLPINISKEANRNLTEMLNVLLDYGVCVNKNKGSLKLFLVSVVFQATLRAQFNIVEHNPNSMLKRAASNSPLSSSIGMICFDFLQRKTHCILGESIYNQLTLAIYSYIRDTKNIKRMNDIALLTPSNKASGESLKRRILDRFSNVIRNIDIITTVDLVSKDMSKYSYLLKIENVEPIGLSHKIQQMKVDYYFTEKDVGNIYEFISIPSRIYRNAFGTIRKEDYWINYRFDSIEVLLTDIFKGIEDEQILRQINSTCLTSKMIFNSTLNLIFFAQNERYLGSKLVKLNHMHIHNNNQFQQVFIHVIKIDGDRIKIKTAEKVIRNLTCVENSEVEIFQKPLLDFYMYYIYNLIIELK